MSNAARGDGLSVEGGQASEQSSIFLTLSLEHGAIASLFDRAVVCEDRAELAVLAKRLRIELLAHARGEELTFYPLLATRERTANLVVGHQQEHASIKTKFEELDGLALGSDEWRERFVALRDTVQHHLTDEESLLFPHALEVFSAEEAARAGEAYKRERQAEHLALLKHASVPGK